MTTFQIAACFLLLISVAGWINARFLHWPTATLMVVAGLLNAALLRLGASVAPQTVDTALGSIRTLNFPQAVFGYMLAFLLFAGAMQVDLSELRRRRLSIWSLATIGVAASTAIVGGGLWAAARLVGAPIGLAWALVFGALISPTDPIAVLAAVKEGSLSKVMQVLLQGEALFNDGVGIVVFTAALAVATGSGEVRPLAQVGEIVVAAVGGLALGAAAGTLALRVIKRIDDYAVEVTITLALATGVYALAEALGVSGPIAVVSAGLLVGDREAAGAMSETSQRYMRGFWTLIDEILNALLFLLVGLEILVIPFDPRLASLWAIAIVLVVAARFAVVLPWGAYFQFRQQERNAGLMLGVGGLHGALSLAMALALPDGPQRPLLLSTTFAVVIFSLVVQGLAFGRVARWASRPRPA
jgi:CPA1 family monovalent cation:H+ antiporter